MHLHWERSNNSEGDCAIQALSWMGKVPEEIPEVIILKKNLAKICKIVKYIVINFRYFLCPDSKCVSFRRMGEIQSSRKHMLWLFQTCISTRLILTALVIARLCKTFLYSNKKYFAGLKLRYDVSNR